MASVFMSRPTDVRTASAEGVRVRIRPGSGGASKRTGVSCALGSGWTSVATVGAQRVRGGGGHGERESPAGNHAPILQVARRPRRGGGGQLQDQP